MHIMCKNALYMYIVYKKLQLTYSYVRLLCKKDCSLALKKPFGILSIPKGSYDGKCVNY